MNRLIVILLIPFLLVGNARAHSHGMAAHQSHDHGRVHIHVTNTPHHHKHHSHESGDHDHGHDHESDAHEGEHELTPVTPVEHDSDAIYLASADDVYTPTDRVSAESGSPVYVDPPLCILNDPHPTAALACVLSARPSELPLYLLHAALRL